MTRGIIMTDQTSTRTALVTGAAGFIASHITRALLQRGWTTRAMDDLSGGVGWSRLENVAESRLLRITGSILDAIAVADAVKGVDVIVHHAALVSVPESVARPLTYHQVNATGTLMVLEAARRAGVKKIIYASTSAAYGDDPAQPKTETMLPQPMSPYAVSKYTGERYVSAYAALHGMATVSLRYFNVFGAGQNPRSQYGAAIPSIVTKMLQNQRPTIYGDGEQTRDFCSVDNVVNANLLAVQSDALKGQTLNIGCGRAITVNQIVKTVNAILGTQIQPDHQPPRPGEVRHSLADISAAKQLLGYEPVTPFDQGLRVAVDWYRSQSK
jgi:UDP-glucose 4-epimerase